VGAEVKARMEMVADEDVGLTSTDVEMALMRA